MFGGLSSQTLSSMTTRLNSGPEVTAWRLPNVEIWRAADTALAAITHVVREALSSLKLLGPNRFFICL